MKYIIIFLILGFTSNCMAQSIDSELKTLVYEANLEMGLSQEQVNQLFTGETRNLTNMNHLECRGDSVIYVCFQKETIVRALKEIDNLKERQLEVFMYVELSPKFRLLISFLIENGLPLYHIIQSPNPSVYTPVIEYDSGSLKQFGSFAEDS